MWTKQNCFNVPKSTFFIHKANNEYYNTEKFKLLFSKSTFIEPHCNIHTSVLMSTLLYHKYFEGTHDDGLVQK